MHRRACPARDSTEPHSSVTFTRCPLRTSLRVTDCPGSVEATLYTERGIYNH